jgi:NAD(P)-dependent dehydrogenase (short-subunit alcohol dehydrogenase family)
MSTFLVTGSNKGIGLALSRQLAARSDAVVATCRRASPELGALGIRVIEGIDMLSDDALSRLARELEGTSLDGIVANAGMFASTALGSLDFRRMREEYDVNALGPLRVVQALLPTLRSGAKIALIGSRAGSIGDNSSGGNYGYRMAKAAMNMAAVSLARDLAPRGIAVVVIHPGVVDTELLRAASPALAHVVKSGDAVAPHVAATDILARIDELTLATTGRFVHREGHELPW